MDALMRRRMMMMEAGGSPTPPEPPTPTVTLLYENSAAITSSTNTGVKLFDPAIDFSILVDATCNHYGWSSSQGVVGLSTNSTIFRIGRISSLNDYRNGELYATANRYYAVGMTNNTDDKRGCSCYARGSDAQTRKKVAMSYDATTRKVIVYSGSYNSGNLYYTLPSNPSNSSTVQLWVGSASGTIHDVKIYQGVLDESQLLAYVTS